MEPYLISPSQFSAHKECPQKHFYIYGLQLRPKQANQSMLVGTYFHELSHFYYQLLKAGYEIGNPLTINAMDTKLRNDMAEVDSSYIDTLLQTHIVFRRYLDRRTQEIDRGIDILEVEYTLQYNISEVLGLMGIVDLIYRSKGRTVIRDHKTGQRNTYSAEGMYFEDQLLTYACMWWLNTGEVPDIEISWINSKATYANPPTNDQLFGLYRKTLSKDYLEAYWQYVQEYVYHMRSVPAIRFMNSFKCKSCAFREPCNTDLRGIDTRNMIEADFIKVPRNHDYAKFTELARKKSSGDKEDKRSDGDSGGFEFSLNFS